MKNVIASVGPVVVVMNAKPLFVKYSTGIFSDPSCTPGCDDYNHAVVMVGKSSK